MVYVNPDIENLYRVKCTDDRSKVLRLDMNENPIGLPAEFVNHVKEKITPELLASYPMKEHLIDLIAEHNGIEHDNITLTAGSEEAMRLIFQCFGRRQSDLITVFPTFEMYDVYSKMFGMRHKFIDYSDEFNVDADRIMDEIDEDTGMIILLNPNSPIGTVFEKHDFERILDKALSYNALVVIDEAYHYFYKNTEMELIKKYNNVIVLRTFSKLCSIAGLRIGYASGSKQLIKYIENAESTFNVSTVSILFATEILQNPQLMKELENIEKKGHEWLAGTLKQMGYKVFSGEGNYVLFYPKMPSGQLVEELKKRNIWVRDYSKGVLNGWVRISTGDVDSMKRAVSAIQEVDKENLER